MSILAAYALPHPPILLPEIGHGEERKLRRTGEAYRQMAREVAALAPDTVIITSPHGVVYTDYLHISPGESATGDFRQFGAKALSFTADYDTDFVAELCRHCEETGLRAGTEGDWSPALDHGTMIPMYFLNQEASQYKLVRIGISGLSPLDHYRLGRLVAQTAQELGRKAVLLASGDLSHKLLPEGPYGFATEGPAFDRRVTAALKTGDFLALLTLSPAFCEAAAECGLRSFQIMAGALDKKKVESRLLSYEAPFGVGYVVAAFSVVGNDSDRNFAEQYERLSEKRPRGEDPYVALARQSLNAYVATGYRAKLPPGLPAELLRTQAGAFVSLHKNGALRGCIGTVEPTCGSLAQEIMENAISAGTRDPRFPPVMPEELPELTISVDVLTPPEPIGGPDALDVKNYGVIVENGHRRGLLLPDLEGVNSVAEQIDIARQKAGIRPGEPCQLFRFRVVRHQ